MEPAPQTGKLSLKGPVGLIIAIAVVIALLIGFPAYRLFFLISVGIGVAVAGILYLWHRFRPISENDVENKRPLGLD
jgi:hypothetical protein